MDSSSNSPPSHTFKDRSRTRPSDLPRLSSHPPSSPHHNSFFPSKSPPAPKPLEKHDPCGRDSPRRSFPSDKDAVPLDSPLDSSDKFRNLASSRRSFDPDKPRDSPKLDKYRSARSGLDGASGFHTPRIYHDRDSVDNGVRLSSNRRCGHASGDQQRRDNSSPQNDERDSAATHRKVPDKERRESSSPEGNDDAPSPWKGVGFLRRESRDFFRMSPRRSNVSEKDCALKAPSPQKESAHDNETKMRRSSPRGSDTPDKHTFSPSKKTSTRDRDSADLVDMDIASPKRKSISVNEVECKESSDTDTKAWSNKIPCSRSQGGGAVAAAEDPWPEVNGSHEEAQTDTSPPSFFHIAKRARSDRERGRREETAAKTLQPHAGDVEQKQVFQENSRSTDALEFNGTVKKERKTEDSAEANEANDDAESSLRVVDSTLVQDKDGRKQHSNLNGNSKSDMEEGELEPEADGNGSYKISHAEHFTEEMTISDREKQQVSAVHDVEGQQAFSNGRENVPNGIHDAGTQSESKRKDDFLETGTPVQDRRELEHEANLTEKDTNNLQVEYKGLATTGDAALGTRAVTKELLSFDLRNVRMHSETRDLNSADKVNDSGNELTLSLFPKSVENGPPGEMCGNSKSKHQHIGKAHSLDQKTSPRDFRGSPEESSQCSSHKQKKLKMETLQLSLSLPGSSAIRDHADLPNSVGPVEPETSTHSPRDTQTQTQNFSMSQSHTNSDGFTTTFSLSQSQSFIHNPSCSLNCTSAENQELSCGGSRQVSQGTEQMSQRSWPAVSGNERLSDGMHTVTSLSQERFKQRCNIPLSQRFVQNGNIHQGFPSVTGSNRSGGSNYMPQRSHHFVPKSQEGPKMESSTQDREGSAKQAKDTLKERIHQQKAWFASKRQQLSGQAGSETNVLHCREKTSDPSPLNARRATSPLNDAMVEERNTIGEKIGLQEIATEPVSIMAQRLQELPDSFLEGLKGLARGVLCTFEKREEFIALQDLIRKRPDLTENTLLRAHRTQLEILVALKTGMQAYIQERAKPLTYKALIDIFLQNKCRNIACQQSLPAGGCECKICSNGSGFCHECMCVVCSKFDSDNNTCRWVGCDVCLHWCHTDCGLRNAYIAPTLSVQSATDSTEMQYHCVPCGHKSELFGFVKEVFQKCAEGWDAETLAKELDCVRKIFHGCKDMRGKQLCWNAEQMLQMLENNYDATEVCRRMLRFLSEGNGEPAGASGAPNKKLTSSKVNDVSETVSKAISNGVKKLGDIDKPGGPVHNEQNLEEKKVVELKFDRVWKRTEIEDIENTVRMKQAEANMFQMRADEARQEAGGLQRIISVKRGKINEDYECKYAKLRLNEAEERRRKWLEELKALENAQHDFQKMKIRMESDIKELLMKMELAKRQFA